LGGKGEHGQNWHDKKMSYGHGIKWIVLTILHGTKTQNHMFSNQTGLFSLPKPKPFLVVAAVCDRRGFEKISPANGAHRVPLQNFCRDFMTGFFVFFLGCGGASRGAARRSAGL
jgi:hypothetical protein